MAAKILILGANGRLGQVAVAEFAAAGWDVLAQARHPLTNLPQGARSVVVDALDQAAVIEAAKGVDVILNGLNPKYTAWKTLAKPLTDNAIAAAEAHGAHLLFPGNVYNYGETLPEKLTEDTPFAPSKGKGQIRQALEDTLKDAAARGVAVTILRGGDYFGGPGRGSWFDLNIAKGLAKGNMEYPGEADTPHAWAYLPDFARAFVALAEQRHTLSGFNSFNFAGHTLTGRSLEAVFNQVLVHPVQLKGFAWGVLGVIAWVVPIIREVCEMKYLWMRPHRLVGDKLAVKIGTVEVTPLPQAIAESLKALEMQALLKPVYAA